MKLVAWFFFNHVITCFNVPRELASDHEKYFETKIFQELSQYLGFSHEFASTYYPQSNGRVEAINKVLKTMFQGMVNDQKPIGTTWCFSLVGVPHDGQSINMIHTLPVSLCCRSNPPH